MARAQSRARRAPEPNQQRGVTIREREEETMRQVADLVERRTAQLEALLAGQVDVDRFVTVALQAVQSSPALLLCTPLSILSAIRDSATYGLEPAGILGDAAIVPYDGVATLQIEYRGLRKLGMRDGKVAAIDADVVYDADEFAIYKGTDNRIVHVPALRERGNIRLAYAWARYGNGELVALWMDLDELYQRRDVSKQYRRAVTESRNDSVWHKWPGEMMKKTVLKRLISEKLQLTPVAREALVADTDADLGDGGRVKVSKPASDTRGRLLARMGIAQLPAGDQAATGTPAGQDAAKADAGTDSGGNGAPAAQEASTGPTAAEAGDPGPVEAPADAKAAKLELCGAPSPYGNDATCRKPKGHETGEESGAKMHRADRETWE